VLGISKKDRSAIALVGDVPDAHVYWLHPGSGRFVTSRHYRERNPAWLDHFNGETMPAVLADTVWESAVPPSVALRSRQDTFPGEGARGFNAFPHRAWAEVTRQTPAALNTWVSEKPVLDSAVLELALVAMRELRLGQDDSPDFLALSFSQTDHVGHTYGPSSREQLDNLLRLDRVLGRLFDELDRAAGDRGWLLAFSSDHGVLETLEAPQPTELAGRRLSAAERGALQAAVERLDSLDQREASRAAAELVTLPMVAAVYPLSTIATAARPDTFAVLYARNHFPGRYPDEVSRAGVYLRLEPRSVEGGDPGSHGSPYWYDRHVPLFFMGRGVQAGSSSAPASTLDAAPTLARLARIAFPADVQGRDLELPGTRP
jgi:predicted AlkP superfamily pyrophosphatase or phosphodiesterase